MNLIYSTIMHHVIHVIILVCCIAQMHAEDVPYIFTPNTPARASEVNANFAHLSERADSQAGPSQLFFDTTQAVPLSYGAATAAIGSLITVQGKSLRMVGMPVFDQVTRKKYRIVYPERNLDGSTVSLYVATSRGRRTAHPASALISGYEAVCVAYHTSTTSRVSTSYEGIKTQVNSGYFTATVTIALTDQFAVNLWRTDDSSTFVTAFPGPWDFSQGIPFSDLPDPPTTAYLDAWIDYLRIEEIP